MAQVAREPRSRTDIDYHLDYQFRSWQSVPEYADWWPGMDVTGQEVFHLEWVGITESRLHQLREWAAQGPLTPAQRARYGELLRLVARHRPILARHLGDDAGPATAPADDGGAGG